MENKLDIVQEENLREFVRQFPVIFDKSHKGYKEYKDTAVFHLKQDISKLLPNWWQRELICENKCLFSQFALLQD